MSTTTSDDPTELAFIGVRDELPPGEFESAVRSAIRLRGVLDERSTGEDAVVLVAFGGGKDSSYAVAFVRTMQVVLDRLFSSTFRLRVVTNRHAGMPQSVMDNIDRVYRALAMTADPSCELLVVDAGVVSPFRRDLPLPQAVVDRNRTDILMTGHRTAGNPRPTFCNACNLSMVKAFGVAAAHDGGVDVIVTGDSPEEQRAYYRWTARLARAGDHPAASELKGFGRFLEKLDGIAAQYEADIHGPERAPENVPAAALHADPAFFSIYDDTQYSSRHHWDFLTVYLGFVFDEIAFSFTESDCGNPVIMAHLRGLKCERVFGRTYAEGLAEYVDFAISLMRRKDFPGHLIDEMRRRYEGPGSVERMRAKAAAFAHDAFAITEETLICMVLSPFVAQGENLIRYLRAEHPHLLDQEQAIRQLLTTRADGDSDGDGDGDGDESPDLVAGPPALAGLTAELERISGLRISQLRTLYRSRHQATPGASSTGLLDAILAGDPHKGVVKTRHSPNGPWVEETLSGR